MLDATYCSYSDIPHVLKCLTTCCFIARNLLWLDFVLPGVLRMQQYSHGLCVLIPLSLPSPCFILEIVTLSCKYMVKRCASESEKFKILGICFCWNWAIYIREATESHPKFTVALPSPVFPIFSYTNLRFCNMKLISVHGIV
jgi:hypothetical protein